MLAASSVTVHFSSCDLMTQDFQHVFEIMTFSELNMRGTSLFVISTVQKSASAIVWGSISANGMANVFGGIIKAELLLVRSD